MCEHISPVSLLKKPSYHSHKNPQQAMKQSSHAKFAPKYLVNGVPPERKSFFCSRIEIRRWTGPNVCVFVFSYMRITCSVIFFQRKFTSLLRERHQTLRSHLLKCAGACSFHLRLMQLVCTLDVFRAPQSKSSRRRHERLQIGWIIFWRKFHTPMNYSSPDSDELTASVGL